MTIAQIKVRIQELLQTHSEKQMLIRLNSMKFSKVCSRCGGTGKHSYCEVYRDMCFQCRGLGYVPPTKTADWEHSLSLVEQSLADGSFDTYMEKLRIRREAKQAEDVVMRAWQNADQKLKESGYRYRWIQASGECPRATAISAYYDRMHTATKSVEVAAQAFRASRGSDRDTLATRLCVAKEDALAAIAEQVQNCMASDIEKQFD